MWWFKNQPNEQPDLPAPRPTITFEIIQTTQGDSVLVTAEWPEGAKLDGFAHMILFLQQGKLIQPISNAIADKVRRSTIKENAHIIQEVFNSGYKPKQETDPSKPVVCPTHATSTLLKPFQH